MHRNPNSWKATSREKDARIALWWGILIHDYWSSLSHGIPPTISQRYHDVPIPVHSTTTTAALGGVHSDSRASFIELCKLTRILGDIVPAVYSLQFDFEEISRSLRRIECEIDDWLLRLPGLLRLDLTTASTINGASNLWFCYLSINLLLRRLTYRAILKNPDSASIEARRFYLANMRIASCDVVDFVQHMTHSQLREFWLPYTLYLLATATTTLLRCTIECVDIETKLSCIRKLVDFQIRLREASESGWDLADSCLERCAQPIQEVADALNISTQAASVHKIGVDYTEQQFDHGITVDQVFDFDLMLESDHYSRESLWDDFEGPNLE